MSKEDGTMGKVLPPSRGYWEKDTYIPLDGERIRHKYYGHEGVYQGFVYTNKSRRHTRIITDAGNTICLPANEWEPVDAGPKQVS